MTLNDETLLSAYLDGELEADERSALESALLSDPDLAKRLRGLAAVRGLVAGLPRPVLAVDLASAVLAGIGAGARTRGFWQRLPRSWLASTAAGLGVLGLAASVIVALVLARRAPPTGPPPARSAFRGPGVVSGRAQRVAPAREPRTEPPASSTATVAAAAPVPQARKRGDTAAAEKVRALLESPRLRRVLIVTDVIGEGGGTLDRVEELVQKSPRTDAAYGRITVGQGIVVDPLHPGEATVFALVMNDEELKHFQKKLEQSFPEGVEDAEADPLVVAQLGEVGSLAILPGTPASSVVIPGTVSPRIALRSDRSLQQPAVETHVAADFGRPDLAAAAQAGAGARAGPETATAPAQTPVASSDAESPPAAPARKPADVPSVIDESLRRIHDPPEIVLVWVTKS